MKSCISAFDQFLHTGVDPAVIPCLRIGFALLVLIHVAVLWPNAEMWFTDQGVMTQKTAMVFSSKYQWSILFYLPSTTPVIQGCLVVMAVHGLLMLLGVSSRMQVACLFVWLVSFQNRNMLIHDGEDTLMRLFAFFMIWLPLDRSWSLQKYWRRENSASDLVQESAWALRLIQFQLIAVYASTALCKLQGSTWHDGTAMWHVARMTDNFGRLIPAALFDDYWTSAAATWSALLLELVLPIILLIPKTRRWGVIAGILLHLGIEVSMNLFLFQWLMILGLISFVRLSDWQRKKKSPGDNLHSAPSD